MAEDKVTKKHSKALKLAFDSGIVRNMKPDEYDDYIQMLMALSMSTIRASKGDKFVSGFVSAALSTPLDMQTKQIKQH